MADSTELLVNGEELITMGKFIGAGLACTGMGGAQ